MEDHGRGRWEWYHAGAEEPGMCRERVSTNMAATSAATLVGVDSPSLPLERAPLEAVWQTDAGSGLAQVTQPARSALPPARSALPAPCLPLPHPGLDAASLGLLPERAQPSEHALAPWLPLPHPGLDAASLGLAPEWAQPREHAPLELADAGPRESDMPTQVPKRMNAEKA